MMKRMRALLLAVLLPGTALAQPVEAPPPDPVGGYSLGVFRGTDFPAAMQPFVRRNLDELKDYHFTVVRHGDYLRPLPDGPRIDVDAVINGHRETIDSFLQRYHGAGIIVVRDGRIVVERYRYGNTPHSRWDIASITKSMTGTAVAAAIQDGKIGGIDDLIVKYVPELKGSAYDGVRIRDALNMSSGVDINEIDPGNGVRDLAQWAAWQSVDPDAVMNFIRAVPRKASPGSVFAYKGLDPYILGEVVRRATNMPLADYISKTIWMPAGAEEDALARTTALGKESAAGGFSATLRDVARYGLFILDLAKHDGVSKGRQVVPADWFASIIHGWPDPHDVRSPGNLGFNPGYGYMNFWYLMPRGGAKRSLGDRDGFVALGANGQILVIVPKLDLVAFIQCADPDVMAPMYDAGRDLVFAIADRLGG